MSTSVNLPVPSNVGAAYVLEPLEGRVLLSGNPLETLLPTPLSPGQAQVVELAPAAPVASASTQVAGLESLFADSASTGLQAEHVVLTADSAFPVSGTLDAPSLIGAADLSSNIVLGDGSSSVLNLLSAATLLRADTLAFLSPVQAQGALIVLGDGSTTSLAASTEAATISITDAVEVIGNFSQNAFNPADGSFAAFSGTPPNTLRSFTATAGNLAINGTLNGNNHAGASIATVDGFIQINNSAVDDVVLRATGNISVSDAVGGISGNGLRHLLINVPGNSGGTAVGSVTFGSSVTLSGSLHIKKGQAVNFNGAVNITGDLIIEEAADVRFFSTVTVGGSLRIVKAGNVTFSNNVDVTGQFAIGLPSTPSNIGSVSFDTSARLDFGGHGFIYTAGAISFGNNVGQSITQRPDSFTLSAGGTITFGSSAALRLDSSVAFIIAKATDISFGNNITAGNVTIGQGGNVTGNINFDGTSNIVESFDVTTSGTSVGGEGTVTLKSLTVGGGNATITANNVDLVTSLTDTGTTSILTLKPYDTARAIVVGPNSVGAPVTRFEISQSDLFAIKGGFAGLVIGDAVAGTGAVYIGKIGSAQASEKFLNRTTIVGGTVAVTQNLDVSTQADYLRLIARTGDLTVNGAINRGATNGSDLANQAFDERNNWVRLEAAGDIVVNQPVYAADRISLTAGTDGTGSVTVNSTGSNAGLLQTITTGASNKRIELIAGETTGSITLTDDVAADTLKVAGTSTSIVLRANGGGISQTGGMLTATTLAVWARDAVTLFTNVSTVGSLSLNGEVLSGGTPAAATANMTNGISSILLTNGGSGFSSAPTVTFTGGGGSGAAATATVVNGIVTAITVGTAGNGYTSAPTIGFSGGGGSGATAEAIVSPGAVVSYTVTTQGSYTSAPTLTFVGDGRTVATATPGLAGAVASLLVTSGGSSYTTSGLTVSASSGTTATASPTTSTGVITGTSALSGGSLYSTNPTVSFTGNGSGVAAFATIDGKVPLTTPSVSVGGSGYTYTPSIVFTGGRANLTVNGVQMVGSGNVSLTNSGALTLSNVTFAPTSVGSFTATTLAGDLSLGYVNTYSGAITLTAAGAITDSNTGSDALPNLVTTGLVTLNAATGIGTSGGGDIDVTIGSLQATNSTSGGIFIQHTGLSGFTVTGTGVQNQASGGAISLLSESLNSTDADLTVNAPITATGSGAITLEACKLSTGATGNTGTIALGAALTTGSGAITLNAGAAITDTTGGESALLVTTGHTSLTAVTGIGASGAGDIDTTINTVEVLNTTSGGIYLQETDTLVINNTGVRTTGGSGPIGIDVSAGSLTVNAVVTADAAGTVTLAAYTDIALGATVSSTSGALTLTAGQGASVSGAITDTTVAETALLVTTGQTTLSAETGIGASGAGDIDSTLNTLEAVNATSGGIFLQETDTLVVNNTGVRTTGGAGAINLDVSAGSLTVNAVVTADASGTVTLAAYIDISLGATVSSTSGNLTLTAGQGASVSGAIIDTTVAETALLATSGLATLDAETGIGSVATAALDIDTAVGSITARNRTSGGIVLLEDDAVTITSAGLINSSSGDHLILSAGGAITVSGVVTATGSGNLLLTNSGASSDITATAAISTGTNGNISLLAARSLTLDTGASVATLGTGTLDLAAGTGSITFADNVAATTGTGNIRLLAAQNITVTGLSTAGSVTLTATSGYIADAGETRLDIVANSARLSASTSIGVAGSATTTALETTLVTLAASATTGISVTESNSLIIGTVAALGVNRVALDATTSSVADSAATSDLAATTGHIVLTTGSVLTLTEGTLTSSPKTAVSTTTGNISLTSVSDLVFEASVVSTSGNITLTSTEDYLVDGTDSDEDSLVITTGLASLNAFNGVGQAGDSDIDTTVGSLIGTVANAVGFFVEETDTLTVASGGIVTSGGNAPVSLVVTTGNLTLATGGVITAHGTGNIHVNTKAGTATTNAAVSTSGGHVSFLASGDINQNADIASSGSGTLNVLSSTGSVTQADGARVRTGSGDLRIRGEQNVVLAGVSTTGNAVVTAGTGSITDAGDTHVDAVATALRLRAGTFIGTSANHIETTATTLTARAGAGGIFLLESDGVTIDDVSASYQEVNADASTTAGGTNAQSDLTSESANGNIVLRSTTGDITLNVGTAFTANAAVTAHGSGSILLNALAGALTANADVRSTTGHITLKADSTITLDANVDVVTGTPGTVSINSATSGINMDATATVLATGSSARIRANGDIVLGSITATAVSIDTDSGNVNSATGVTTNVTATDLRLQAQGRLGRGSSGSPTATPLAISVDKLSAYSVTDGIFLTEASGVTVTSTRVVVSDFNSDATTTTVTDAAQSDLTTGNNGHIVLTATTGDITLNDGNLSVTQTDGDSRQANGTALSADGSGNIRVNTPAGSLTTNAAVSSTTGHITFIVIGNANLNANVSTGGTGTIDVDVDNNPTGSITQADGARFISDTGTVRLRARADVSLASISTSGAVVINTISGSVIDAGDTHVDVIASSLRVRAGTAIGSAGNHLETTVATLSALASSGGIFLTESDGLTVTDTAGQYYVVASDGTVGSVIVTAAQADLTTQAANGSIVLVSTTGDIVLDDGTAPAGGTAVSANGSGSILIDSLAGSLTANADILSGTGHITLKADDNIALTANVDVTTASTGTVSLDAETGTLTMHGTANVTATSSSARLRAQGDITVGNVTATDVSIDSDAGSILNAASSTKNVTATNLRLQAQNSIGASDRHLTTSIDNVTALAATGSIYLTEDNTATVTNVTVSVTDFTSSAGTTTVTDAAQSDLTTGANGDIVLVATLGDLTLNDGSDSDNIAVSAHGSGSVLLRTLDDNGAITLNADVRSGTGHLTVKAGSTITLTANVDVVTGTPGTISVNSITSGITMDATATVVATGSSARIRANGDIVLGSITATAVSIDTDAGNVNSANGVTTNVTATDLRLQAQGRLGRGSSGSPTATPLAISVDNLSAYTVTDGIYLTEVNGITVTSTRVVVSDFNSDATTTTVIDAAQSDLTTGNNGQIVLVATAGDITLNDGNLSVTQTSGDSRQANGTAVSADGTGSILIDSLAGSLTANADILSGTGQITLKGRINLDLTANVDVTTASTGTASLDAETGALAMHGTANVTATSSSARLRAQGDITVGNVTATNVSIDSDAGSILNAASSSKNVTATNLRLQAQNSIGASGRHLTTSIDNVTALASTGSIYVTEDNAATVTNVAVTVTDFNSDLTTTTVTDAAQSDLTTGANGNIVLVATLGDLTLNDGSDADNIAVTAHGTGNILLQSVAGTFTANADLLSGTGHITLKAANNISLTASVDVTTAGTGTQDLVASTGSILMATTATLNTVNGDIRLTAGDAVLHQAVIGDITASNANVAITTPGSILDADTAGDSDI
ncbi:MAG: hypothetical protein NTU80_07550, partial [Verrucomicrobia bacterium]|nr:hypothetical protein [Verrucomicrobiota bacterium]